jgi:hypothetical protein
MKKYSYSKQSGAGVSFRRFNVRGGGSSRNFDSYGSYGSYSGYSGYSGGDVSSLTKHRDGALDIASMDKVLTINLRIQSNPIR